MREARCPRSSGTARTASWSPRPTRPSPPSSCPRRSTDERCGRRSSDASTSAGWWTSTSLSTRRSSGRAAAERGSGLGRRREHRLEQLVEPCGREADRGVGGPVVEADVAARRVVDEAAGEDDVGDVAGALVGRDGCEHPPGEAAQDAGRLVEVEQREADAVDLAGDGLLDAVVDQQPAVLGTERRRADADAERVPPGAVAGLQDLLRRAPADEVVGAREEDLAAGAAELRLRA